MNILKLESWIEEKALENEGRNFIETSKNWVKLSYQMAPFHTISPQVIKALPDCPSLYFHGEMKLSQWQAFQAGA